MDLLIPDWPLPQGVRAACSTRSGGVSLPPFDSLNLGDHVNDVPQAVGQNRARYAQALGARPVFLQQVHGWDVVPLTHDTASGATADAALTRAAGVACTMMVADCLPVLLARQDGSQVAAAHAGWRGLAGQEGAGVLEAVVNAMLGGVQPCSITVWLGPCIGPQAFEVGSEVRAAFVTTDPSSDACFAPQPSGKYLADLAGLARRRLGRLGITAIHGNDSSAAWCTVGNPSRFFSHRRDQGRSGRFAASIWRV
jgi:YfiH family protein